MADISVAVSPILSSNLATRQTSYKLAVDTGGLDALSESVQRAIKYAVLKGCSDLMAEVIYQIKSKNLIKTGNLMGSVSIVISEDGMTGMVIVGANYGIYLEYGTKFMAARPFFGPAVEAIAPKWSDTLTANLAEALGG